MYKKVNKDIHGNDVSPVFDNDIKNYLIDIDGTICDDIPNEQPERMVTAKLYEDALLTLNKWYEGQMVSQTQLPQLEILERLLQGWQ